MTLLFGLSNEVLSFLGHGSQPRDRSERNLPSM